MILCGDNGLNFTCGEFTCVLNRRFNVVLFTNSTFIYENKSQPLGFIVPVDYLSFIKTIDISYSCETPLDKIFTFKNPEDRLKLSEFISNIKSTEFSIINDLKKDKKEKGSPIEEQKNKKFLPKKY